MSMPTRLFKTAFTAMVEEMRERLTDDEIVAVLRQMRKQGPRFARNEILRHFAGDC
jgi:hypothetical protein